MRIGVPREVKNHEYRVGMTPNSVREAIRHNHQVVVETKAGDGISRTDDDYRTAGATILGSAAEVFATADMIVKVKEPQVAERKMLREGQILFTYLHLAPDPQQTRDLVDSGAVCIAYETVTDNGGGLPLLAPMSQIAGRMSVQAGAHCLERTQGGAGVLLAGVPGVRPAKVVIVGGGIVGESAAYIAVGMGADVTILDLNIETMRSLEARFRQSIKTLYSTDLSLEEEILEADLVIGAVLVPGAEAPKLITSDLISRMKTGSVICDVAIDQGGCTENSRPTTHAKPTYTIDSVVHYCVANMPGAVSHTSTFALNNATLPFTLAIADKGYKKAIVEDPNLLNGLNVCEGKVTYKAVANDLGYDYVDPCTFLGSTSVYEG
ncbi:MAG: alanine dehydrogenase [Rhodospirillaceae bacterium TMED8]|nr:alanine dehydrogenase [Magnetovibrio sp.]OUT48989.1 MAG: alanine dehydrogenase [Rhodospirillaceae bacterium TMED8]